MRVAVAALLGASLVCGPATADSVGDFYRAKPMRFIIRTPPGGEYDLYSRLLARHMLRHIPGPPASLVPVNMPAGGGIVAANFMAEIAPRDGTVLGMLNQGVFSDQALGLNSSLKIDLRTLNWLGLMTPPNVTLATHSDSPTRTLADAMRRETLIGASGAGSVSVQLPAIANNVLGTKLKIIFGYSGGAELDLAMERGEIDGRAQPYFPGYRVNVLIQTGLRKNPNLPESVPLLRDLGKTEEDKAILGFLTNAIAVGWPIGTTPGVPPERVAALRQAFEATLTDADFLREAAQERAIIARTSAAELEAIITDLMATPAEIKQKAKQAMEPKPEQQGQHAKGDGK